MEAGAEVMAVILALGFSLGLGFAAGLVVATRATDPSECARTLGRRAVEKRRASTADTHAQLAAARPTVTGRHPRWTTV